MSNTHKNTRESSRYQDATYSDNTSSDELAQKAGNKRLFSNRNSRFHDGSQQYGLDPDNDSHEEVHSGKRQRSSDWPLRNFTTASPSNTSHSRAGQRNRKATASSPRRPTSSQVRQSKFVEGSMNDRVSRVPPAPYLGDQDIYERYEQENHTNGRRMAQPRKFMQRPDSVAGSVTERSDISRQSSIFRFGKTIAATFNPTNWFGRSRQPRSEYVESPQEKVLRQRKEKAEQIYEDLKKSGRFADSHRPPSFDLQGKDLKLGKHDSGVAFGGRLGASAEMTREEKRMGRVFLDRPHVGNRGVTPPSMVSESIEPSESIQKSGFRFKPPSLSSLRKGQGSDRGSVPLESGDHQAKRIPSRKDLQYQQKLVKRYSDLESKLESTRRKLLESMHEPVPSQMEPTSRMGRPRFVPGALSTLPSERLLAGYVNPDNQVGENDSFSQIGKALTVDHQMESFMIRAVDVPYDLNGDAAWATPMKRDKSLPEIPNVPDTPSSDHVMESVESEIEEEVPIGANPAKRQPKAEAQYTSPTAGVHYDVVDQDENEDPERFAEASDEEEELKPAKRASLVKTTTTKKRKSRSSFERLADHGGKYKPALESDDSESESVAKRVRTPKKTAAKPTAAHPRKLQKTTQQSTPKRSPRKSIVFSPTKLNTSPQNRRQSAGRSYASRSSTGPAVTSKKTVSTATRSSSKLAKPRKVRRSMSPPPFSSSPLEYAKPSSTVGKKVTEAYSAISGEESDVPPMPKLPKAVRLPSGEVISTVSAGAKLTKPRPGQEGSKGMVDSGRRAKKDESALKGQESFIWERDVF